MAATVFSVILREIEEKHKSLSDALASGAAKDFAEYKFMCKGKTPDFLCACLRNRPRAKDGARRR